MHGGEDDEETETLVPSYQPARSLRESRRRTIELSLCVLGGLVLLLAITLLAKIGHVKLSSGFEPGWSTEIGNILPV